MITLFRVDDGQKYCKKTRRLLQERTRKWSIIKDCLSQPICPNLNCFTNLEVATSAIKVMKLVAPKRSTHFLPNLTLDWLTTAIRSTRGARCTFRSANLKESLIPLEISTLQCSGYYLWTATDKRGTCDPAAVWRVPSSNGAESLTSSGPASHGEDTFSAFWSSTTLSIARWRPWRT